MANQQETTVVRKRQQIASANRTMFAWVAIASVIVGAAAVAAIFLAQKGWFNERVLAEKMNTESVLQKNLKIIDGLKDEVRVMNTNQALRDSMAPGETQPIQVVLDALPADANSSAFGASLQSKFLTDPALQIEALNIDAVAGVEVKSSSAGSKTTSRSKTASYQVPFNFTVTADTANVNALKDLLLRLERSIRAIDVTKLTIEGQGNRISMTVDGNAFYEPAKTVELKDKTLKP
jgi:hypothetical protein